MYNTCAHLVTFCLHAPRARGGRARLRAKLSWHKPRYKRTGGPGADVQVEWSFFGRKARGSKNGRASPVGWSWGRGAGSTETLCGDWLDARAPWRRRAEKMSLTPELLFFFEKILVNFEKESRGSFIPRVLRFHRPPTNPYVHSRVTTSPATFDWAAMTAF